MKKTVPQNSEMSAIKAKLLNETVISCIDFIGMAFLAVLGMHLAAMIELFILPGIFVCISGEAATNKSRHECGLNG